MWIFKKAQLGGHLSKVLFRIAMSATVLLLCLHLLDGPLLSVLISTLKFVLVFCF